MDRRILIAKISKLFYKFTYRSGLLQSGFFGRFAKLARKSKHRMVAPQDALVCLPKNEVIQIGQAVQTNEIVLPTQVIDYFIDKSNYRAIMNFCMCRDSNACKDYPREYGCLFLGEAAKGIHPEFCRPATKEEAKAYIKKCSEAGLVHILGKAFLDSIWLDIGPHDRLFTICNCCPCCCISKATQYMPPDLTDWFHKMPGVSVHISEACAACGVCADQCLYTGITVMDDRACITEHCRACGRCVAACPQNAIQITIDDADYIQKTIAFLEPRVDLS